MRHPNVVATAIGYYRIRRDDPWPGTGQARPAKRERTLANSEVRPYSWPAVLVLVERWVDESEFSAGGEYAPQDMVPRTLYLPDGRRVPACVIEAPKELEGLTEPPRPRYPLNNIGSGRPVLVELQQREHVATIGCLATDGHRVYAITNRHVAGDAGEEIRSRLDGKPLGIGVVAPRQLTRVPFSDLYPSWPGRGTYVNLDVGLIDVTNVNRWTARLEDGSRMGPMVDLSSTDFPLDLVGRKVRGCGAASGWMRGEIQGLFYRYKSRGGFEYVADFFIGASAEDGTPGFATRPGNSGTVWLLEPDPADYPPDGA